jgi:hypothetical protein
MDADLRKTCQTSGCYFIRHLNKKCYIINICLIFNSYIAATILMYTHDCTQKFFNARALAYCTNKEKAVTHHRRNTSSKFNLLYTMCLITPQNKVAVKSYPRVCTSPKENDIG